MKQSKKHGFLLSLLINMALRFFWPVIAILLLVFHFVLGWPLWVVIIPLVCWVVHALIITLIVGWATSGAEPKPEPKNINPYSNKDYPRDHE